MYGIFLLVEDSDKEEAEQSGAEDGQQEEEDTNKPAQDEPSGGGEDGEGREQTEEGDGQETTAEGGQEDERAETETSERVVDKEDTEEPDDDNENGKSPALSRSSSRKESVEIVVDENHPQVRFRRMFAQKDRPELTSISSNWKFKGRFPTGKRFFIRSSRIFSLNDSFSNFNWNIGIKT